MVDRRPICPVVERFCIEYFHSKQGWSVMYYMASPAFFRLEFPETCGGHACFAHNIIFFAWNCWLTDRHTCYLYNPFRSGVSDQRLGMRGGGQIMLLWRSLSWLFGYIWVLFTECTLSKRACEKSANLLKIAWAPFVGKNQALFVLRKLRWDPCNNKIENKTSLKHSLNTLDTFFLKLSWNTLDTFFKLS